MFSMKRIIVRPTSSGLWHVEGGGFGDLLRRTRECEEWATAADMRFEGVQRLLDAIPDEDVVLDWNDGGTRAAMELIYASAADHLAVGEVEMAAALWENLAAMDEDDHMSVNVLLALCYVELEDYDCLEEAMFDISTKTPEYHLLTLWSEYRRTGGIDRDALRTLRTRHKEWFAEFVADEHPVDEAYLADSRSERPSVRTEARELWFATAAVWERNADFLQTIKKA